MDTHNITSHHPTAAASDGSVLLRIVAIVLGLILAFAGIAMGVTMVLLPLGIPLGLIGLMMILWGATPPSTPSA